MKNLRLKTIVILLALTGLTATMAFAYPGMKDKNNKHMSSMNMLSPEKKAEMKTIYENSFKAALPIRKELMAKEGELQSVLFSKKPDLAKIDSITKEIGTLKGQLESIRAKTTLELINKNLTFPGMGMHSMMNNKNSMDMHAMMATCSGNSNNMGNGYMGNNMMHGNGMNGNGMNGQMMNGNGMNNGHMMNGNGMNGNDMNSSNGMNN